MTPAAGKGEALRTVAVTVADSAGRIDSGLAATAVTARFFGKA